MFETTNELSGYLAPNERVLWQGQGKRRLSATSSGGVIFIVMFVAMAFIFFGVFAAMSGTSRGRSDDAEVAFIIMPIIMLSIGLGVGIPLLIVGQRTSNGRYFVTTASVLILYPPTTWAGRRLTVLPLKNLPQITLSENRDGTGTLTFGQSLTASYGRYSNSWMMESTPTFSNIDQPRDVYQLIRKQMAEA